MNKDIFDPKWEEERDYEEYCEEMARQYKARKRFSKKYLLLIHGYLEKTLSKIISQTFLRRKPLPWYFRILSKLEFWLRKKIY